MSQKTYAQLGVLAASTSNDLIAVWPFGGPLQVQSRSTLTTNFLTTALLLDGTHAMTAQLPGYDGSVGTPGYGFASDPDTGIYRIGANTLGIATGGVLRAQIDSSGITANLVGNVTGNASTATKWATARNLSLTGDGTATLASVDGSAAVSGALTLATVNSNVGTYGDATNVPQVTVNAKGLITAVSNVAISGGADVDLDVMMFGDGSDGDATISGSVSLAADKYYNNLTISTGAAITMNGFRIFVKGTLDITGAPAGSFQMNGNAGNNASGVTQGGGVAASDNSSSSMFKSVAGTSGNGGAGGTAGGSNGTAGAGAGANMWTYTGGTPGVGGTGGSGGSGTVTAASATGKLGTMRFLSPYPLQFFNSVPTSGTGGGGGGAGGGGDGTAGGGGGGGGGAPGYVGIWARTISRGGSTAAGTFQAKGGAGGNGGVPAGGNRGGGGGGAGGTGGLVYLVYRTLSGSTATNAIDVTGGNGGNGGNGTGTGTGGTGGGSGPSGCVVLCNLSAGTISVTAAATATSAGSGPTGTTGGSGATATASRVSL